MDWTLFRLGGGSVREGFPADALQPLRGIAVRQFQQGHTRLVALLLHLVGGEKNPHHGGGVLADLLRLADETLAVPLQVGLVVRRHMVLHRAVLVGTAMETQVRCDPDTREEDFYCGPGRAHIHLLPDVLIRHRVVHALYADMVIVLDSGDLPNSQLERSCRQRLQKELLLGKTGCPAAFSLLKWLVVEGFQFLADCLIQFHKGQKLAIAQRRQNPGGDHTHRAFHKGFVLGTAGPGGENGGAVVFCHLLIGLVEHRFRPGILDHTGLEVVRREDADDAAEIPVGVDMTGDPGLLFHVQESLCVGVSTVRKHRHKQVGVQPLPGVCVRRGCCLARPVHLHGLAGLVFQVHGSFGLVDIVRVILVELGGLVGQLTALSALLTVFHPQQAQGDTVLLHFTVYPFVVRHFVNRPL